MKEPRNWDSLQLSIGFRSSIWEELCGDTASQYLAKEWDIIFGIFQLCIDSNSSGIDNSMRFVIPAQTGTGKTLAAAYFASTLPKETGMLIVTFLTDEADRIKKYINKWSGEGRAISYHSKLMYKDRVHRSEFKNHQILVITHNEFKASVDRHKRHGKDNRIKQLYAYKDGHRDLIVIDESIDNIISNKVDQRDVRTILGKLQGLPNDTKKHLLEDIDALSRLEHMFEEAEFSLLIGEPPLPSKGQKIGIKEIQKELEEQNFSFARARALFKSGEMRKYDATYTTDVQNKLEKILDGIDALMEADWAYYYLDTKTNTAQFRTARSTQLNNSTSVILDATSSVNHYYSLHSDVDICKLISDKVRSYQSVTLYVSKKQATGKVDLCGTNIKEYAEAIINRVTNDNTFQDTKVAIFTHKRLEEKIDSKYKSELEDIQIGHFGNLQGLNTYKDCNVLYIFGLPYKPEPVYTDLHALSDRGLDCFEDTDEVSKERTKLENTLVTADVIQMINRVSCRNVIDSEGNCPDTTVHMLLPNNAGLSKTILDSIQKEMPGIVIKPWDFVLKTSKKPGKKSKYEELFLKELPKDYNESILFSTIADKLNMSKKVRETFRGRLQVDEDSLSIKMKKASVAVKTGRRWMLTKEI